jgi:manganese efflux pump family protein
VLGLILVAFSLGASNLAASIGIGLSGVDNRMRLRIGLVFGLFEAAMPVLGLLIGRGASHQLGSAGHEVGAGLLVAVGAYTIATGLRADHQNRPSTDRLGRLLLTGLALSIDNLVIGFALGTLRVELAVAAAVIAVISVGMSLVGLEIGGRIGGRLERRSELIGGAVLIAVGVALATGLLG